MTCRFRGSFDGAEKERIERAVGGIEQVRTRDAETRSAWAFLHFTAPYDGCIFWGVRSDDGHMIGGNSVEELVRSLKHLRRNARQIQDPALAPAPGSVRPQTVEASE